MLYDILIVYRGINKNMQIRLYPTGKLGQQGVLGTPTKI
jgi:hypothetical protein